MHRFTLYLVSLILGNIIFIYPRGFAQELSFTMRPVGVAFFLDVP